MGPNLATSFGRGKVKICSYGLITFIFFVFFFYDFWFLPPFDLIFVLGSWSTHINEHLLISLFLSTLIWHVLRVIFCFLGPNWSIFGLIINTKKTDMKSSYIGKQLFCSLLFFYSDFFKFLVCDFWSPIGIFWRSRLG